MFVQLGTVMKWCLSQPSLPSAEDALLYCVRRSLPQLSVDVVLPALLRWSGRPTAMNIRVEAMACLLDLLSHFETHQLLPYKRQVLKELPIGDHKRLIRRAAATAAIAWHMLGEV